MSVPVRYQVFVSSTYEDLREERQQATQAILEAGSFPSGMELFPASDDTQWELIKRVISECDYYVVIVGGKYGSTGPNGLSYTEMEYDFATEQGIPVLGFVKESLEDLPAKRVEADPDRRGKLETFREKVMSRTCRKFRDPLELGMAVMKSLMHEMRIRPRVGWVRADQARSKADLEREIELQEELRDAQNHIEELERLARDRIITGDEIPRSQLAQGSDVFEFTVSYRDNKKQYVTEKVPMQWDEIFSIIGPSMYGYIVWKHYDYRGRGEYKFSFNLATAIRSKIVDRCQGRQIELNDSDIDTCVMQLKELGYIEYKEQTSEEGKKVRGITLTEEGERYLTRKKIITRTS